QGGGYGPLGNESVLRQVGNLDLFLIGDIDEDTGAGFLELKRLRMRVECDLSGLLPAQVQKREGAVAVTDDYATAASVIPDIIGVAPQLDGLEQFESGTVEYLGGAIGRAGHEQAMGGRVVVNSLRFGQIRNR